MIARCQGLCLTEISSKMEHGLTNKCSRFTAFGALYHPFVMMSLFCKIDIFLQTCLWASLLPNCSKIHRLLQLKGSLLTEAKQRRHFCLKWIWLQVAQIQIPHFTMNSRVTEHHKDFAANLTCLRCYSKEKCTRSSTWQKDTPCVATPAVAM